KSKGQKIKESKNLPISIELENEIMYPYITSSNLSLFKKNEKDLLSKKSQYSQRVQNVSENYGLLRVGKYTYAEHFDEAYYITAILNTPIIKKFMEATNAERNYSFDKLSIFLPKYDEKNKLILALKNIAYQIIELKKDFNPSLAQELNKLYLQFFAAVVLPTGYQNPLIQDSKILSPSQRKRAYRLVKKEALEYKIIAKSAREVEVKNPLAATKEAMVEALVGLKNRPDLCLVDGQEKIVSEGFKIVSVVGGDRRSINIAAASIIAKVTRDTIMQKLHKKYPLYD
ncbi:18487_t:CDS:2, partial [Racocetra persica]